MAKPNPPTIDFNQLYRDLEALPENKVAKSSMAYYTPIHDPAVHMAERHPRSAWISAHPLIAALAAPEDGG